MSFLRLAVNGEFALERVEIATHRARGATPRSRRHPLALGTRDLILSSRTQERMYLGGDTDAGIVSLGPAAGFADAIEPAGKIVERLVEGACAALGGDDRAGGTGVGLSP
ncbi:hypothetical protein SGO26_11970 [Cupriavidus metallidurans]|uniref:hypothetical protein n=1 Tax=Cupriavidus TaxID=106589 RepID=UPI0025A798F6|nr:hypothetical protein [Cupriavidus sp. TKC]GMG90859.1 hypothetical protein Cmtc_20790 [Cupriavidus sp. TKC]